MDAEENLYLYVHAGRESAAAQEHAQAACAGAAKRRRLDPQARADTQNGTSGGGWSCWPDQDDIDLSALPAGEHHTALTFNCPHCESTCLLLK